MIPPPKKLPKANFVNKIDPIGLFIGGGMTKKGFTVVELVAVLAVICILAALILPALFKAREMARSTQCISNLKQIIQAVRLYVEDDTYGRLPGFSPTNEYKRLISPLLPYLGEGASVDYQAGRLMVFRCPSNENTDNLTNRQISGNQTDYVYNENVNNQVAQTKIMNPEWASTLYDYPSETAAASENIHRGGSNIAFFDGHVQWFPRFDMMSPHAPESDPARKYNTWGIL